MEDNLFGYELERLLQEHCETLGRLAVAENPISSDDRLPRASRTSRCSSPRSSNLLPAGDIAEILTQTPDPGGDYLCNGVIGPHRSNTGRYSYSTTSGAVDNVSDFKMNAIPDFAQLIPSPVESIPNNEHKKKKRESSANMMNQDVSYTAETLSASDEDASECYSDFDTISEYSCSERSASPDFSTDTEPRHLLTSTLDHLNRDLLRRLMLEVYSLLYQHAIYRSRTGGRNADSNYHHQSSTSNQPQHSERGRGKRRQIEGEEDDTPDGDTGNGGGSRYPGTDAVVTITESLLKFACPYYTRNPAAHGKHRSCAGPGFTTIHRLKEHLYRRHALPPRCERCCVAFEKQDQLKVHLRQDQSCVVQKEAPIEGEGFDKDQEKLLKSRKRKSDQSDESKWRDIFLILFPDVDVHEVPSPYQKCSANVFGRTDSIYEYECYSEKELPKMIEQVLESKILGEQKPLEIQLASQLVDIVRACQVKVYNSYVGRVASNCISAESSSLSRTKISTFDLNGNVVNNSSASNNPALQVYRTPSPLPDDVQIINSQVGRDIQMSRSYVTSQLEHSIDDSGFSSFHPFSDGSQLQGTAHSTAPFEQSQGVMNHPWLFNQMSLPGCSSCEFHYHEFISKVAGCVVGHATAQGQLQNMETLPYEDQSGG